MARAKGVLIVPLSDEETALAVLFSNTKRKKRTVDLLTLAKACEFLVEKYRSRKEVASKLGLSTEMIREFLLPLKLPNKIQNLISERKIDSLDVIKEISSLKGSSQQIEAAVALTRVPSKDVRDIVRLVREGNVPVSEAKDVVFELKSKGLHIFLIDFDSQTYKAVQDLSNRFGLSPALLVKGVVQSWLNQFKTKEDWM